MEAAGGPDAMHGPDGLAWSELDGVSLVTGPVGLMIGEMRAIAQRRDVVALLFPCDLTGHRPSAIVFDPANGPGIVAASRRGNAILLLRTTVSALSYPRVCALTPDAMTEALTRLVRDLAEAAAGLTQEQARLAARALTQFAAIVLARVQMDQLAPRDLARMERLIHHVDHHLADPLDVETLCATLGCSRSALYRAVNKHGGVARLIEDRRLRAVYARLTNPGERASIAALAAACGLVNREQFSRSFKRRYGLTATQVRAAALARDTA